MAMTSITEKFEGQQGTQGVRRRNHGGAWQASLMNQAIKRQLGQEGQEQEKASKPGVQSSRLEVKLLHIGKVSHRGPGSGRPFLVVTSWQASKAFFFQDVIDGHGANGEVGLLESSADIIDGQVLFP